MHILKNMFLVMQVFLQHFPYHANRVWSIKLFVCIKLLCLWREFFYNTPWQHLFSHLSAICLKHEELLSLSKKDNNILLSTGRRNTKAPGDILLNQKQNIIIYCSHSTQYKVLHTDTTDFTEQGIENEFHV